MTAPTERAAQEALQQVGLEAQSGSRFAELSGGQQQRVLIARAIASKAKILILDEPTTGIDEYAQSQFYTLLETLKAAGIAILMVSHDIEAVLRLTTRVICLNQTIVYDGPPAHFDPDTLLPSLYGSRHRLLHHDGGHHA